MTGRWETLTADQQAAVLTNLRGWLDLGHDPLLRSAIAVLDGDPHPDCGHEWHGADGGPCPGCGWDSHPIPADRAVIPPGTAALPEMPALADTTQRDLIAQMTRDSIALGTYDQPGPLVVPYQGGRHTGTPTIDLLGQEAS